MGTEQREINTPFTRAVRRVKDLEAEVATLRAQLAEGRLVDQELLRDAATYASGFVNIHQRERNFPEAERAKVVRDLMRTLAAEAAQEDETP